ncbi:MAG TPA: hypothetical protein VMZ52_03820 [Bryobacteraceae bacterium]|nr:hypothetical protein [Bryobacteraceae bacterium]
MALAVDLPGTKSNPDGYRLDGDTYQEFIEESLPPVTALGRVGSANTVSEFKYRDNRKRDFIVTRFQRQGFE